MAPNRRKSRTPSAAAAAAARQNWKVGDLVLAKVKGFPAWPATVSEPEKWGYKPDSKKVLVFFFGTNQIGMITPCGNHAICLNTSNISVVCLYSTSTINTCFVDQTASFDAEVAKNKQGAFCSHIDVEAFTEEKKQSLQGKRYGKSADFVRAVKEIIESYDKLKTQAQDEDLNPGVGVTVANGENSVGNLVNPGTNDPTHYDSGRFIDQLQNGSFSTKDKLEGSPPFDDAASMKDDNQKSPRITSNSGTPVECSHVFRKKPEVMDSLANVKQRRPPSTRRLRSARIDARRQQDTELPSEDGVAGTGNMVSSTPCNGSSRNGCPGISTLGNEIRADSPLLVSNSNPDDNTSGTASFGCNSFNRTEGSSFDSACIPEHTGTAGNSNENVALTKKHGLDIKAVFVKKKRKPNRKWFATDSQELTASVDNTELVFGVHNYRLNSPNASEKSNESPSKVDGDEYLPLVKRARVRMDKLSDVEGHVDTLMVDAEEKSTNGCSLEDLNGLSRNSLNNYSSNERELIMLHEPTGGSVTQADSTISANGAQLDTFCKGSPCDKVDGEGGLRLSMRLHQALETMLVGAPENSQPCDEEQLRKSPAAIVGGVSSLAEAAATLAESGVGDDPSRTNVNAVCNNDMEVEMATDVAIANPSSLPQLKIPLVETDEINQCSGCPLAIEAAGISKAVHNTSGVDCLSLDAEERNDRYVINQFSGHQFLQYNEKKNYDSDLGIGEPPDHKISSSDSTEMSKCVVRKDDDDDDTSKITHNTDPDLCVEDKIDTKTLQLSLNGKMPAHCMSGHDGELKVELSLKSGTSIEVMELQHDSSQLGSVSDERSCEKVVLGVQTSSSSISGPILPSPSVSSLLPTNSTQKSSILQNNSFVCPPDKLLVKREENTVDADVSRCGSMGSSGKVTHYVEAKASLTSFGNAIGILTRTKDSIGRATRMAIDCAKAGLASKVVDILSRTLENESSLNRKVDLFFLVDSMMQCSRGLKGEVGGIYPSAIQAALPRLLSAAVPPGNAANENRRQCLKVLKLWLERRILPDSVIRHHMQNLDSFSSGSYSSGPFSRRSSRTERAFHDPLREMEGMLVDEYGSNSSFQLSGFCMPRMRKDDSEGSDSDGSFEAVTPEHESGTPEEPERLIGERHRHILEDVDGELEMEDAAPSEAEMNTSNDVGGIRTQISNSEVNIPSLSAPPLPSDVPPSSPPLPTSPPPPHVHPPPPPQVPHQSHSMPVPLRPPHAIHSLPAPHPVCPPHGHSLPLSSAHPLPPHPSIHPLPPSAVGCPPPLYPPIPVHPSTDVVANGADSMAFRNRNNSVDNLPCVSPRKRPSYGDSTDFRASDRLGAQRQMGVPDPSSSCSFDSFSGPRHAPHPTNCHSVQNSNGVRHSDCPNYDNRGYNAPPPPLGPPNNYPSVQGDHRGHHSWREGPPRSYENNYSRGPSRDDRSHYNDHSWRKPGSHERYEDRRYYGPSFPGDKGGGPYPPHPYPAPSNEHNRGRQGWGYPPREMHHRNSMSVRPSSEGARYWRE